MENNAKGLRTPCNFQVDIDSFNTNQVLGVSSLYLNFLDYETTYHYLYDGIILRGKKKKK